MPGVFDSLRDSLLAGGDRYMHLADLTAYLDADRRLCKLHGDADAWTRRAILNVAGSGRLSSADRRVCGGHLDLDWRRPTRSLPT